MSAIRDIIAQSEYLLLFLVIGIGFLAGQIRVKGFSLGISGVLFAGLAFGGWRPEGAAPFHISQEIEHVGLILFVYAIGLTSGPGFFSAMQRENAERPLDGLPSDDETWQRWSDVTRRPVVDRAYWTAFGATVVAITATRAMIQWGLGGPNLEGDNVLVEVVMP